MQTSSARMRAAIKQSYTLTTRAEVYYGNELIVQDLPFNDFNVTVDKSAAVRRQMDISIPGEALWVPGDPRDALFPKGTEIQLYAGVLYPDGTAEEVGVGRFRVSKPRVVSDSDGGLSLTVQGSDRSAAVARARFGSTYTIPAGTYTTEAIQAIIVARLPVLEFIEWPPGERTTNRLVYEPTETDPWEACLRLAEYDGMTLFFDAYGMPRLYPEPDPAVDEEMWRFVEGEQGFTLVDNEKEYDEEVAYNWVVVRGENSETEAIYTGEAFDANPDSPTYIGAASSSDPGFGRSPFGAVPFFATSEYINSNDQADSYARAELSRNLGIMERFSFTCTPNMLIDADDVVYAKVPDTKIDGRQILETIRFSSNPEQATQVTCRGRRVFDTVG